MSRRATIAKNKRFIRRKKRAKKLRKQEALRQGAGNIWKLSNYLV
jgi:hypothetical protein